MSVKDKTARHSIGVVAKAAGVTTQTIRLWEMRGHLASSRTSGGQRLFNERALRRAVELAAKSKRLRQAEARRPEASPDAMELASTGMRIKRARLAQGQSQAEAARRIGISRSFLATVERGESGVSTKVLAKLADAFGIPMSGFAAARDPQNRVIRKADRPHTLLAGGVAWEELAAPSSHDLEPALLYVPAGQGSGGVFVRPGEAFVFILEGGLDFQLGEGPDTIRLDQGDALIIEPGLSFSWSNPGRKPAHCMWVEFIGGVRKVAKERQSGRRE